MVTENVDGMLRQVFDFSKSGVTAKFYAPLSIGGGYRAQIQSAKGMAMVDSSLVTKKLAEYFEKHPAPKGIPFDAWYKSKIDSVYPVVMGEMELKEAWRADLAVFESILTPAIGSISVKQWYMELSTDEEIKVVKNFTEPTSIGKTETEPETTKSGKVTKPKRAPAA